jgi:hypothetical protein
MQRSSLLPAIGLMALQLVILPSAANAGGVYMPLQVNAMPATNYGPGTTVNAASNVQTNLNISGNLGSQNSINVQTNIEGSKTIDSSSNISVTNTVNGYQVDYGLNGAYSLNVIDNADAAAANSNSQRESYAAALEADALQVAQAAN